MMYIETNDINGANDANSDLMNIWMWKMPRRRREGKMLLKIKISFLKA